MADVVVTATPFIPVKPLIKIGTTGSAVSIECAAEELTVEAEADEQETVTFCGTTKSYKPEVWTITVSVFPSYGTTGLWNTLRPLVGTSQAFEIRPDGSLPASPTNPAMTGTARVKPFNFYAGKPGEPTAFDVELGVVGTPSFALALAELAEQMARHEAYAAELNAEQGVAPTVAVEPEPEPEPVPA
jgi:hypothetical protein